MRALAPQAPSAVPRGQRQGPDCAGCLQGDLAAHMRDYPGLKGSSDGDEDSGEQDGEVPSQISAQHSRDWRRKKQAVASRTRPRGQMGQKHIDDSCSDDLVSGDVRESDDDEEDGDPKEGEQQGTRVRVLRTSSTINHNL